MCSLPAEATNKSKIEKRKKNYQSLILSPQIISCFAKIEAKGSFHSRDGHWSQTPENCMAGRWCFLGKCLLNVTKFLDKWWWLSLFLSCWLLKGTILKDAGSLKNAWKGVDYPMNSSIAKGQRGFCAYWLEKLDLRAYLGSLPYGAFSPLNSLKTFF